MSVFPKKSNKMGVFTLSMLNIAAVLSIVNFPEQAEYGYAIIFYITAASICFFIPTALVSAELAAAWPKDGGMYLWVKEAFGPKWGFVAVCMQWLNSLPWYATVLTFVATTLAYIFKPELATNRWFVFLTLAAVMWGCTILNFRGIRLYAILSSIGAIFGTIIPTAAIILLAAFYLFGGHAPAIPFTPKAVLPELNNMTQWMLLAGMMVAIAGIDMPAVHVTDVDNPQKNFPKAILISSIIIIFLSIAGSLSISLIVPPGRLSMASGAAEAFDQMFTAMGARWMTPVMCVFLIWGALTTIITWTLGPSKGLLQVAREGYLPEFWQRRNQYGIPVPILTLQALITTVIGLVIFFMPTISGAFWVMMALSAQLYMIMYMFMFSAAIRLRYSQPDTPRPYSVPCGKPGMWIVAGLGFLTSVLSMTMGFIPPQSIRSEGALKTVLYLLFLTCGMLTFIILPQLLHYYQECRMKKENQPSNNS